MVQTAAVQWQTRLASGDASDSDYQAFADWIAEDATHAAAFSHVESTAGLIDGLRPDTDGALDHFLELKRPSTQPELANDNWFPARAAVAASLAAVLVAVAGVFGYQRISPDTETMAIAAQPDQFRTEILSDGTKITLAPGAEFEAVLSKGERKITSLSGVSYFDVASDPNRPFTIDLGRHSIRVVGTEFEVTAFLDRQSVAVSVGIVRVLRKDAADGETRLTVGEQLTFSTASPAGFFETTAASSIGAWRTGVFEFENADANRIATRLNAFYGGEVYTIDTVNPPEISFSGVLALSDPAGTVQKLSELAPVAFTATQTGYVLSERAEKEN